MNQQWLRLRRFDRRSLRGSPVCRLRRRRNGRAPPLQELNENQYDNNCRDQYHDYNTYGIVILLHKAGEQFEGIHLFHNLQGLGPYRDAVFFQSDERDVLPFMFMEVTSPIFSISSARLFRLR